MEAQFRFSILYYADLINIGYEAPAGQMFSTTNDLAKLMKMLFRPETVVDLDRGQVNCWYCTNT